MKSSTWANAFGVWGHRGSIAVKYDELLKLFESEIRSDLKITFDDVKAHTPFVTQELHSQSFLQSNTADLKKLGRCEFNCAGSTPFGTSS